MNSNQAKKIPLRRILEDLGHQVIETKDGGRELWYLSPFRTETAASFNIIIDRNVWFDFGEGKGGTTIDFIMKLHHYSVKEALEYLSKYENEVNFSLQKPKQHQNTNLFNHTDKPQFEVFKVKKIMARSLINYLDERKISLKLASKYLQEVHYKNKEGKTYYGLGMLNEFDGYEVRNKYFKSCIGNKGITYIRDPDNRQQISVFEGFFDFLSCMEEKNKSSFKGDVVILHSLSFMKKVKKLVDEHHYEKLYDFLDNDVAGDKQRAIIDNWGDIVRKDMRYLFDGFKDYNDKITGLKR